MGAATGRRPACSHLAGRIARGCRTYDWASFLVVCVSPKMGSGSQQKIIVVRTARESGRSGLANAIRGRNTEGFTARARTSVVTRDAGRMGAENGLRRDGDALRPYIVGQVKRLAGGVSGFIQIEGAGAALLNAASIAS